MIKKIIFIIGICALTNYVQGSEHIQIPFIFQVIKNPEDHLTIEITEVENRAREVIAYNIAWRLNSPSSTQQQPPPNTLSVPRTSAKTLSKAKTPTSFATTPAEAALSRPLAQVRKNATKKGRNGNEF